MGIQNTVESRYNAVLYNMILHIIVGTWVECESVA